MRSRAWRRSQAEGFSNPSAPVHVGTYDTPGFAHDIVLKGNHVFVVDETSGVIQLDISNPSVPRHVSTFDTAGEAVHISIIGDYFYVSDSYSLIILR